MLMADVGLPSWKNHSNNKCFTSAFFVCTFCCNNWWLPTQFKEPFSWVRDCPQGQLTQVFLHLFGLLIKILKDLHLTGSVCEIKGLHVHHLQPAHGQPASLSSFIMSRQLILYTFSAVADPQKSLCTCYANIPKDQELSLWHSWWQVPFTGIWR
jgi:hypothetical protein